MLKKQVELLEQLVSTQKELIAQLAPTIFIPHLKTESYTKETVWEISKTYWIDPPYHYTYKAIY